MKTLRIFVSSPGDVKAAREIAALTIERLAQDYGRFLKIEPYLWEFEAMVASGHFQDSIEPPSAFDVVVLIVWSRLGTSLPERTRVREYRGIDGRAPVTGTEWEFEEALRSAQASGAPDLLVYRSRKPAPFDTRDPERFEIQSRQLKALNGFWERHFANQGMFIGAYSSFTTDAEFAAAFENHLRKLIEKRISALGTAKRNSVDKAWVHAPFRGLEAYEFDHAPIFFGQDEALAKAMLQLTAGAEAQSPFLLVLGASGSGKSSLVKAGILPKLFVPRRVAGTAFLRRVVFRPSDAREGEDLFDALARRLTTQVSDQEGMSELIGHGQSAASLATHFRNATATPAYPIGTALGQLTLQARQLGRMLDYEDAKLVLVIDQLEELFTSDRILPTERGRFSELLTGLVRSGLVWVIATMRIDFWHRAAETPELMRLSEGRGRLELLPPGPAQLSQIIRRPAEAAGISFEVHGTSNVPLNDLISEEVVREPGALPLLSYLLDQIYRDDILVARGDTLTYATYERLGRLEGAIATRAEEVLQRCAPEERDALGSVLFSLVRFGASGAEVERAVARRVPLSAFAVGSARRRLVEALLDPDARLVVSNAEKDSSPTIRVAHEALISRWTRAREFVERHAEALKIRRRVEERYLLWRGLQRPQEEAPGRTSHPNRMIATVRALRRRFGREKGLLSDIDVTDGKRLLLEHGTDTEPHLADYIERSVALEKRTRNRAIRALAFVAIVVTLLAVVAVKQRNIARSESVIANRTTKFMVDLFEIADPDKSRGASITVREILDDGAKSIRSDPELIGEPRVRAELQTAMGQAYSGLGLYESAEQQLTQARADEQTTSIPDESRVRTLIAMGTTFFLAGDNNAAARPLRDAVNLARENLQASNPLRSAALKGLADVWAAQGKYVEAEQLCREALVADRKRAPGPENSSVLANTLDALGATFYYKGDLAAGEAPMREALQLREEALGLHHARTAQSINNLGALLYETGRYAEAVEEYQRALPIYKEVYGSEHPEVATLLNNLGRSALMAGHVDEAEPLLRQSLSMTEKFEGDHHEDLVAPLNSVALIDFYHGRLDAASGEIQRAETIARLPDHGELLDQVLLNEADLELASGHSARASVLLSESKNLLRKSHPNNASNAWRYARWDTVNAAVLAANGEAFESDKSLAAANRIIRQRFGATGFYSQLAERRVQQIKQSLSGKAART
ncbi:MAG TPA: tetratricopeptide repeat protein [Steroidobacteraceae bacterium]|jgi:tetratricopeptide (TPR) repeat protein|nr:tetratricopeptide repeat protein [Steroidobacteraceae bacterium]